MTTSHNTMLAAINTLEASRLTLLRVRLFGHRLTKHITPDNVTYVVIWWRDKPYLIDTIDHAEMVDDTPIVTLDQAFHWARNILAIVGAASTSVFIGLYFSGYFDYLFSLVKP